MASCSFSVQVWNSFTSRGIAPHNLPPNNYRSLKRWWANMLDQAACVALTFQSGDLTCGRKLCTRGAHAKLHAHPYLAHGNWIAFPAAGPRENMRCCEGARLGPVCAAGFSTCAGSHARLCATRFMRLEKDYKLTAAKSNGREPLSREAWLHRVGSRRRAVPQPWFRHAPGRGKLA